MAMGTFVFNIAKGRVVELVNRVDTGDPAAARLVVIPILAAGVETDATLKDYDTVSALLAAANDEATGNGWTRKTITSAMTENIATNVDDSGDRMNAIINTDQTWTAVSSGTVTGLIIAYSPSDPASTGDAANIPLTAHAFAITPDGSDVTADIGATGFYYAS